MGDPGVSFRRFQCLVKQAMKKETLGAKLPQRSEEALPAGLIASYCRVVAAGFGLWSLEALHLLGSPVFAFENYPASSGHFQFLKHCLQGPRGQESFGSWQNFSTSWSC